MYAFIPTINTALPLLLPFLAGFLPIFMGYAVLATAAFGQTVPIFATVPRVRRTCRIPTPSHLHPSRLHPSYLHRS